MRSLWPRSGLWRHPDFLKLWSAETISQFGSQITGLALPLIAVIAWLPVAIGPVRTLREVPHVAGEAPQKIAETESEALLPGPTPQFEEP